MNGEKPDCSQWKENFEDCQKWSANVDQEAAERVIGREEERVQKRWQGHFENNVWMHRDAPPEGWNSELPEHLQKASENSYLKTYMVKKNKPENDETESILTDLELNVRKVNAKVSTSLPSYCSIM